LADLPQFLQNLVGLLARDSRFLVGGALRVQPWQDQRQRGTCPNS
jgi:hypothetical protein